MRSDDPGLFCELMMKRYNTILCLIFLLIGCDFRGVWGPEVGGLTCRLHKTKNEGVVVSICNKSANPVTLPTLNDEVPRLTLTILEEPSVISVATFGGALSTSKVLQPGEVYRYDFRYHFPCIVTPEGDAVIRFTPTDDFYHLKVTIETEAGDITFPIFKTKLVK